MLSWQDEASWFCRQLERVAKDPAINWVDFSAAQDGACKEALRNAYFPFSLGPRICTGAGFAKQEAMIVLSSLIRNYRFEAVPEHVPVPIGRLTVCSENGIRLRVFKR